MYNKLLNAFIAASELGSFSKAAEKLYISPTAVVKQINQLEYETKITLFYRTKRGVFLTEAGKSLYEDSKQLIIFSSEALQRARQIETPAEPCIRIGTSVLRPERRLCGLWAKALEIRPDLKIHIVPFEDNYTSYLELVKNMGKDIDVIAGVYPSGLWENTCNALKLFEMPICCAVSQKHPLAKEKKLVIQDLFGEKIMMRIGGGMDAVRNELMEHPEITIVDTHYYDVDVFNKCESTRTILLTTENWSDVHPMLKTLRVDWNYYIPYGLIYPKNPSLQVEAFIEIIRSITDDLDQNQIFPSTAMMGAYLNGL